MVKAIKIILLLRHLLFFMGSVFVEKWSNDQGCLILQSQMFKVWWDDGGHHQLLYQVQDQIGNRKDSYEKGRGPGRQLQSGWVLMVKSSKSRCQSWKRVPIVQTCVGQRFANLSRNPIWYDIPSGWFARSSQPSPHLADPGQVGLGQTRRWGPFVNIIVNRNIFHLYFAITPPPWS